jgi:hypothetical protein
MKRYAILLLVVALVVGALAPAEAAKKKKKKPKKPVAVDVVYKVVGADGTCTLSVDEALATDGSCGDPFGGAITGEAAGQGSGPTLISAVDGLPLTLDTAKPVKGAFIMGSYTLAALADNGLGQPLGAGEAQWEIILTGTSGGEEVTIGEVTTETYMVTPGTGDYEVNFEITPAPELAGKTFDALTLSLLQVGPTLIHGAIGTDATSSLTIGAFAIP